ncbi:PilN domain-containing protein [Paenibacillus albus]|uniref:Fimbrial assembly protein n=1 Tax=Paenibacillus albus TaxID=2495582 RepID=A0A3S9AC40_9BACL|nr:hypothetical protein [Paenibacillus albus]AZN43337.1 hypothetical protein EJC50_29345 [Paenibacillus albus]
MMQLSDINLLPRQEKASNAFKAISLALVLFAIIGSVVLGSAYFVIDHKLTLVSQELESTTKLQEALDKKLAQGNASSSAVNGLQAAIIAVEKLPTPAVSIVNHLVALLPERGFIQSFNYSNDMVQMTVQFDTLYETSAFLDSLNSSGWVESVVMPGVSTSDESGGAASAASSGEAKVPRHTASFEIKLNMGAITEKEGQEK